MAEFDAKKAEFVKAADQRADRYHSLLEQESDLVSIVLRGHLVFEEVLFRIVQTHCANPDRLEDARLRFPQLIALVRSLLLDVTPPRLWESLTNVNALRNALAHNLDPSNRSERLSKFVTATLGEEATEALNVPPDSKEAVLSAIAYTLGALQMVDVFAEALEHLIKHGFETSGSGSAGILEALPPRKQT